MRSRSRQICATSSSALGWATAVGGLLGWVTDPPYPPPSPYRAGLGSSPEAADRHGLPLSSRTKVSVVTLPATSYTLSSLLPARAPDVPGLTALRPTRALSVTLVA